MKFRLPGCGLIVHKVAMLSSEAEQIMLPGGPVPVQWRRNARARRISLRIHPKGAAVVVTLPPRGSRAAGMRLLLENAGWVADRLAALPTRTSFEAGASVPLHGLDHQIAHQPGMHGARIVDQTIQIGGDPEFLARRVADFLRAEARRSIGAIAIAKADRLGIRPRRISIKDTSSRWGSCTARRDLAFSWRLVMAPIFVQDYVAAHEVAHFAHMNHSDAFWRQVAALTDHTDAAVAWLQREGPRLMRIG